LTHPTPPPASPLSLHDALPISGRRRSGSTLGAAMAMTSATTNGTNGRAAAVAPPHNLDAEQSVLGAILLSYKSLYPLVIEEGLLDRKSTRLNSSHDQISYAVFC